MFLIFNKKTWKIILLAWIFIWMFVFFKNLIFKGYLKDYIELLNRPGLEEKRAYVTGDALYGEIKFCKANLPEGATFGYKGIVEGSLADRRIRYYLYPHLKSDRPDYLIIFDGKQFYVRKAR